MVTYDARPSGFTQLATTADWENFVVNAGIMSGVANSAALVPSLDTAGRNAVISAGTVIVKGQLWRCDAPVSTPVPAGSAANRVDRLVMRLNRTASTSPTVVAPFLIQGASGGGLPPISQTTAGNWDVPICHWTTSSSGALSGLVDERTFAGRTILAMTSSNHRSRRTQRSESRSIPGMSSHSSTGLTPGRRSGTVAFFSDTVAVLLVTSPDGQTR